MAHADSTAHPDVYGVVWHDLMLGTLYLNKPDAAQAVALAESIRAKGEGKTVSHVRAVWVKPDNSIVYLDAASEKAAADLDAETRKVEA